MLGNGGWDGRKLQQFLQRRQMLDKIFKQIHFSTSSNARQNFQTNKSFDVGKCLTKFPSKQKWLNTFSESDHCALSLFSLLTCSLMFWGLVDIGVHESIGNSFTINEGGLGTFFNARRHGFDPSPPSPPLNNVQKLQMYLAYFLIYQRTHD